ncbi:MAG: hypothetical protein JWN56_1253 [Sphingobacteriales bacterium]|nr:hypothetical protein [Sphingobacteriales bacterium]
MNINKISTPVRIGLLAILITGASSCTKSFEDLNTPKDKIIADKMDVSLLGQAFAQSQYRAITTNRSVFQVIHNLYCDYYAQYFATVHPNFPSDQFSENGSWTNAGWSQHYSETAPQIKLVEDFTAENKMVLENAIAKVWRVEAYHRITDLWGPIIYSEFGNAKTSVSYDSQKDIYYSFFKTLDEAVSVLKQNPNGSAFAVHDLIYAGNVKKWLTFANSLRLRLAIRISYVEPELAKLEAEKAIADGVMMDNTDNANLLTTINSLNGYPQITYISEFRMSASMTSTLVGYNDPRLSEFYDEAAVGGGYKGIRNGLPVALKADRATLNAQNSFIDVKWLPLANGGTNPPERVMSAPEVYFLRAEGALRGWNMGGTAQQLYETGIMLSLKERTNATDVQINTYIHSLNTPVKLNDRWNTPAMSDISVQYNAAANFEKQLEQIITQKWIALFPDSYEAWAERRRTGYPKGFAIIQSLNSEIPVTDIVRRLTFTSGEISSNNVAVEAGRKLLNGPDKMTTRLWWDAKPLLAYPDLSSSVAVYP